MAWSDPKENLVTLPIRFRNYEELTDRQKVERFHRYHFINLKAKDLKPLLKNKFHPVLKAKGFSKVSDSLSVRLVPPHYVHCVRIAFDSVYAGRFFVRAGIALDFLPLSNWTRFNLKRLNLDTDCVFTKNVRLANGHPEFDNGANATEATKTIEYLISAFKNTERDYFNRFMQFPEPFAALDVNFMRSFPSLTKNELESEYGSWGPTEAFFTLRLAMIHEFVGNKQACRQLLEYGLANYQLFDLKKRYERLLNRVKKVQST